MIENKSDLKQYLNSDNQWLRPESRKDQIVEKVAAYPAGTFRKYLKLLRKHEYYINSARGN